VQPLPNALLRNQVMFMVEAALMAVAVLTALFMPERIAAWGRGVARRCRRIACRPAMAVSIVFLFAFLGAIVVALTIRFPRPAVHDEFSYLLAADTFASGRLTNPTHPFWEHFESFHVLQQPSYMSKYPPGQALFLALGQVIGGHPVVGIWLSIACLCAAAVWMLQGWMPRRWALLGGILAAFNFSFFGFWSQNYWGGAVAAFAGALLFGAWPRIRNGGGVGVALLMGTGLFLLAVSRPFEGLLASVPVAFLMLKWLITDRKRSFAWRVGHVVFPLVVILLAGACWMAYYNVRVTGSALRMPYELYQEQYNFVPITLGREVADVPSRCRGRFYERQMELLALYRYMHTWAGYWRVKWWELRHLVMFFFRFALLVPLVMLCRSARTRRVRFMLLVTVIVLAAVFTQRMTMPRKVAPIAAVLLFLAVQNMRYLAQWKPGGRPVGRALVTLIPVVCLLSLVASTLPALRMPAWPPAIERARLSAQLKGSPGRDLVMVRYAPWHSLHHEWVYNRADIDEAEIVWAKELDTASNRGLFEHFADRRIWLLEADAWRLGPLQLVPYPGAEGGDE
jgi:hypothetical protein